MKTSPFLDLVRKRRSVRSYAPKPLEREAILSCLEAARLAPSACNVQPWRFVVVDAPDLKSKLCNAAFSGSHATNRFAGEASVIITVVADPDLFANVLGATLQGTRYFLIDIGIACAHLVLRAAELGLGACVLGWFNEGGVKRVLGIPRRKKVVVLISIGYPAEEKGDVKKRKTLEEIASFNAF